MNDQPRLVARPREPGVLGEEAVAGMDGLGAAPQSGLDDDRLVQIGLLGGRRPDAVRLVRETHVDRVPVGFAEHRHRAHALLVKGTDHPDRDLTSIGDQNLAKRGFHGP